MFALPDKQKSVAVMSSNLDNMLYGILPAYEQAMDIFLKPLQSENKVLLRSGSAGKE